MRKWGVPNQHQGKNKPDGQKTEQQEDSVGTISFRSFTHPTAHPSVTSLIWKLIIIAENEKTKSLHHGETNFSKSLIFFLFWKLDTSFLGFMTTLQLSEHRRVLTGDNILPLKTLWPIPVAVRSKVLSCNRSTAGITGSNSAEGIDFRLFCIA